MRLSWMFPLGLPLYFASAVTGPTDSGGATAPASGGAPASPPGGGGASTGGSGTPSSTPGAPPQVNWGTAPQQFRDTYEATKQQLADLQKKYEPYSKFEPGQVERFQQGYSQVYDEISAIGQAINVTEQEITEAIQQFGVLRVLDHLRQEAYEAEQVNQGNQDVLRERDLQQRIERHIEQALTPIQQRENQRMTFEANALTERTIHQMATEVFKGNGLDWNQAPEPLRDFVSTGVTEVLKYDDAALTALKFEGKTAGVQKAFQTFMSMWDAAYMARRQMESRLPPPRTAPGQKQQGQGKQPSIDELIENPDLARTSQGRPAYST